MEMLSIVFSRNVGNGGPLSLRDNSSAPIGVSENKTSLCLLLRGKWGGGEISVSLDFKIITIGAESFGDLVADVLNGGDPLRFAATNMGKMSIEKAQNGLLLVLEGFDIKATVRMSLDQYRAICVV